MRAQESPVDPIAPRRTQKSPRKAKRAQESSKMAGRRQSPKCLFLRSGVRGNLWQGSAARGFSRETTKHIEAG